MNCRLSLVSRELNIWTCHLELRYSHIKLVHVLSSSFKFDVGNHLQIILWLENRCKRFKRNVIHMTNILWRRKVDLATQLKNNEGIRVKNIHADCRSGSLEVQLFGFCFCSRSRQDWNEVCKPVQQVNRLSNFLTHIWLRWHVISIHTRASI